MGNVAVVGAQWGDEGKGKIVDWLSERADVVVRFHGGHNAGHTLVIGEKVYKLSLLPSGIVRGKLSVIGNGVVVDPWALLDEIERISGQGVKITPDLLRISENAALILPVHGLIDRSREAASGGGKIGTTGRGIGPAYEDKIARRAIRLCDLADDCNLEKKVKKLISYHNVMLRGLGEAEFDADEVLKKLRDVAPHILPFADVVWQMLDEACKAGQRVLFEGAQGTMLDIDHGTYPFVTSSNTVSGCAASGSGIGPGKVGYVLGVCKAYATRVGSGPFPTELQDANGDMIGERGHEFGTVTGRKRRCGWFDAVLVRQASKLGSINGIALTKLDVLDGFETLKICTGYRFEERIFNHLPASEIIQAGVVPVYETLEGWKETTMGVRSIADLPLQAVRYIRRIEELTETSVALLSTSPERDDTILIHDPFAD